MSKQLSRDGVFSSFPIRPLALFSAQLGDNREKYWVVLKPLNVENSLLFSAQNSQHLK